MECNVQVDNEDKFSPLPVTPSKPPDAKMPTIFHFQSDSTLKSKNAVVTLANLINSRSDAIEKMVEAVRAEIKHMNEKIACVEKHVEKSVRDCHEKYGPMLLIESGNRAKMILDPAA